MNFVWRNCRRIPVDSDEELFDSSVGVCFLFDSMVNFSPFQRMIKHNWYLSIVVNLLKSMSIFSNHWIDNLVIVQPKHLLVHLLRFALSFVVFHWRFDLILLRKGDLIHSKWQMWMESTSFYELRKCSEERTIDNRKTFIESHRCW